MQDIEKLAKDLKEKAEKIYIDWCNHPERDEEGEWINPSLSASITLVLDEYFEENEDDELYNKIEEILESSLDARSIHESMAELKENYRGLSGYERNSGKY
jgi:DNA segregation ATPase FtsK/SpoIIIE-like protein